MRGAAQRGHLVLGLGDFNMIPKSLAHQLICAHSPMRDAWLVLHPDSSIGAAEDLPEKARQRPIPTAAFNIQENGTTCDSVLNTWRWSKDQQKQLGPGKPHIEVPEDTEDIRGKRLDYIFASTKFDPSNPAAGGWVVKDVKVGMIERHPELQCSVSDHFSVEATLMHIVPSRPDASEVDRSALNNGAFLQSPTGLELQSKSLENQLKNSSDVQNLPLQTYDEILAMIKKYTARENQQRRLRLGHFVASVVVSIGCFIAVWWSPRNFVSFILILVSSLGLFAGTIDGLIGGLFVGHELRALKEFEWEIHNARGQASGEMLQFYEGIIDW